MLKKDSLLYNVINTPLTSVNFTKEHVSLDFNELRLSFGEFPIIKKGKWFILSLSDNYPLELISLIGISIRNVQIDNDNYLFIEFTNNTKFRLDLNKDYDFDLLTVSGPNLFEIIK